MLLKLSDESRWEVFLIGGLGGLEHSQIPVSHFRVELVAVAVIGSLPTMRGHVPSQAI